MKKFQNKNSGFTLAEVLITLAIVGVIAALTIPAVVKNYQKTQIISKLKKVYSAINQAYNMSQAENGMYQTWDKGKI
jgi:prepilin-type N-terminal cleavage/methylation domain-containing protein